MTSLRWCDWLVHLDLFRARADPWLWVVGSWAFIAFRWHLVVCLLCTGQARCLPRWFLFSDFVQLARKVFHIVLYLIRVMGTVYPRGCYIAAIQVVLLILRSLFLDTGQWVWQDHLWVQLNWGSLVELRHRAVLRLIVPLPIAALLNHFVLFGRMQIGITSVLIVVSQMIISFQRCSLRCFCQLRYCRLLLIRSLLLICWSYVEHVVVDLPQLQSWTTDDLLTIIIQLHLLKLVFIDSALVSRHREDRLRLVARAVVSLDYLIVGQL